MKNDLLFLLKAALTAMPLLLFVFLNSKANLKKEIRSRQFYMPIVAVVYCIVLFIFMNKISQLCLSLMDKLTALLMLIKLTPVALFIRGLYNKYVVLAMFMFFNTAAIVAYVALKFTVTKILSKIKIKPDSLAGKLVGIFYEYDETDCIWYIKPHLGQARTFLKAAYFGGIPIIIIVVMVSLLMFRAGIINTPFYPVFALIIIGELAFFVDGLRKDETKKGLSMSADNSSRKVLYPLLRKPLRTLFGDKLSSEGTTFCDGLYAGGSIDDILADIEKEGGHLGSNYAAFIRTKMEHGLKPNVDYVRCGYDLASGKSLLFNTPFYDKLTPYVFYAMNRELLKSGKVMIVLGRHGTAEDLTAWCRDGMRAVTNVPEMWKIGELNGTRREEDELPDIGIISRSSVHDLDIHRTNLEFLKQVSFVFIVEPSRLVTTAQIGLNLLIKCCGKEREITFCSVDRNCDGLVDSLSHILMTNITEVSATEHPHGVSSYMCWTADSDYLQHRIVPGVSRYLGMGTELSMAALKNQVQKAVWYGGEKYPVLDAHWIAKQYYYDLLEYAGLPATQETFDKYFQTSFNMCNEKMNDYSYIVVEDERNNVFETKRNFATIAEKQGFVNVISSEYMLREYMTENTQLFTADAKAIPYVTADYARTNRNVVLTLCLKLCVDGVREKELIRELMMMGIATDNPGSDLWNEVCALFGVDQNGERDAKGNLIITVPAKNKAGRILFEKDSTITFSRRYSVSVGAFESVYSIENKDFAAIILDDLQNAGYIAEQGEDNCYIGTELKGHIYQKYLPGQFFTLNGKYYEMVSVTADNRILVRRASEHINGRLSYRQVRRYSVSRLKDSESMGALRTVNGIAISNQFADFSVNTPAYWKLSAYNDFKGGDLVELNGVPERRYFNKQLIKLDFSKLGDAFTDEIRMTLTVLLNEVFVTMFADNQPFICAVTPGEFDIPVTYSIELPEDVAADKCIYIVEDSQLDIGLLIAVERNLSRILQIVADYLDWNDEMTAFSKSVAELDGMNEGEAANVAEAVELASKNKVEEPKTKKPNIFVRFFRWIKSLFTKKKKKDAQTVTEGKEDAAAAENEPESVPTEPTAVPENIVGEGVEQEACSDSADQPEEKEPEKRRKGLFGKKDKKKKPAKEKKKKEKKVKGKKRGTVETEPAESAQESPAEALSDEGPVNEAEPTVTDTARDEAPENVDAVPEMTFEDPEAVPDGSVSFPENDEVTDNE